MFVSRNKYEDVLFEKHCRDEEVSRLVKRNRELMKENERLKEENKNFIWEELKKEIREIATNVPKDKYVSEILVGKYYDDVLVDKLEDEFWDEIVKAFHVKDKTDYEATLICCKGGKRVELLLKDISELEEIREEKENKTVNEFKKEAEEFLRFLDDTFNAGK